jgi:hypothetical protein
VESGGTNVASGQHVSPPANIHCSPQATKRCKYRGLRRSAPKTEFCWQHPQSASLNQLDSRCRLLSRAIIPIWMVATVCLVFQVLAQGTHHELSALFSGSLCLPFDIAFAE